MNSRNLNTLPSQVVSLRNVVRVCVHAAIVLILTMLSVGRAAAQDSWATKAQAPGLKPYPISGEIDGLIYVYGYDDASNNPSSFVPSLGIYDPASDTWTTGAPPNLIRAGASGGIINGKMYVVGGCIMADCGSLTNVLEIYDPVTNTWSYGAPAPTVRFNCVAGVIAGKLYVTGGQLPGSSRTNITEIYDPTGPLGSWTTGVPIPTSRENAVGAVVNGLFYVIGGFIGSEVGTVQVYDPSPLVNSWSTRSPMPTFRGGAAVGVINGHIYVVGGNTNYGILSVNESYDPEGDYWTERTPMPTARASATGSVVNSKLYVIGGTTYVQPLGVNEEYSPAIVPYSQCLLFDPAVAHRSGSTVPIKLALCDSAGANVSDASVAVVAQAVYLVSTSAPGPLADSGNANPDYQFRFTGGSYTFNLSLKGFSQGTYELVYKAGNDPTNHTVQFQVR